MANNKFAEDGFEFRSSIHEQVTGRSYRLQKIITDKISKGNKFTFEDVIKMQLDTRDEFLSEALPSMLKALTTVRQLWSNKVTEELFERLEKWDYFLEPNSI